MKEKGRKEEDKEENDERGGTRRDEQCTTGWKGGKRKIILEGGEGLDDKK